MQFSASSAPPLQNDCDCLVAGVYENGRLSPTARLIDQATDGAVTAALADGDAGKAGRLHALYRPAGIAAGQALLVGLGAGGENDFLKACAAAAGRLHAGGARRAAAAAIEWRVGRRAPRWKARQLALAFENAGYRYRATKPSADAPEAPLEAVVALMPADARAAVRRGLEEGAAIAAGQLWTRELGDLPPNVCTPRYLAAQARQLARNDERFSVTVLDRAEMKKRGMGALLAVARGSAEPPQLITIEYRGSARAGAPIALVGKGVTFDTGGISIKPANDMDEMKFDMCGAASVLGVLRTCAALNLPLAVTGVIPATENMPGGGATRPGDVVTTASGRTVEILNTDAEGRLILCDALHHAASFEPRLIIDVATLTGACVVALGKHPTGLFTKDAALERRLRAAGNESWDRVWPLPLWDDYQAELDSNFADIANIGKRYAGATTAACFLSRFVGDRPWAHLDIAGTAWRTGAAKGATGRPVPLLAHFLMQDAGRL